MYSILIRNSEKSLSYVTNTDGSVFAGDSDAVKDKLLEIASTYPIGKIVVVHNVNLTTDFTIEDAV